MDNLNPGNESSEANQEVDLLEGVTFDGKELPGEQQSSEDQDLGNKGDGNEEEVVVVVAPKDRKPEDEKKDDETPKFINQDKVNKVINEKHRKMREAEEKAIELERKNTELQQKLSAFTMDKRPDIPQLPDPLSPDIVALTATRDKAIEAAAVFDLNAKNEQETKLRQEQSVRQAQEATINTQVQAFGQRAAELGYVPAQLAQAERTVVSHLGRANPLNQWLLGQDDGPLLVDFLSQNLHFTEQLSKMQPTDAAIKIRSFMPGVAKITPQQTEQERLLNNPAPAKRQASSIRNKVQTKDPYLQGVKFS